MDDAPLNCNFSLVSLGGDPQYEAVSYVWVDTENPGCINVSAMNMTVPITSNLHSVLANVRLHDRLRVLWVDALCINQKDVEERSSQVAIMAAIYSKAKRVLAYLGNYWKGGEMAVEAIRQLAEDETLHFFGYMDHDLNVDGSGFESLALFNATLTFLDTPWWARMWTVQEFVIARKAILLYGRAPILGSRVLKMCASKWAHEIGLLQPLYTCNDTAFRQSAISKQEAEMA